MIPLRKHQPLFQRFGETFASVVSGLIGRRVVSEIEHVEVISRDALFARVAEKGIIVSTSIREPKPGIALLYLTANIGVLLPDLLINPGAAAPPREFSPLHRSALDEMLTQVWNTAGPEFASHLRARFTPKITEIVPAAPAAYMGTLPVFSGISEYVLVLSRITVEAAGAGLLAQIYPAVFWTEPDAKTAPAPKMEQFTVVHIETPPESTPPSPVRHPAGAAPRAGVLARNIAALKDVPMEVTAEIGRTQMSVGDILSLGSGVIVQLDHEAGRPIDILMGGRPVARGEIVLIDSQRFGVRITQMLSPQDRMGKSV